MKLNETVIQGVEQALKPLERKRNGYSEDYVYTLTYLEMMIRERIKVATYTTEDDYV
jgi:hypothetical protein